MKNHRKIWLALSLSSSVWLTGVPVQKRTRENEQPIKRTALQKLMAVSWRSIETLAGVHMLIYNSPHPVQFFSFTDIEQISQPGLADNLCQWRVRGWRPFYLFHIFTVRSKRKIHTRSVLPSGIIELMNNIPTQLVGGALTFDGVSGLYREYKQIKEEKED